MVGALLVAVWGFGCDSSSGGGGAGGEGGGAGGQGAGGSGGSGGPCSPDPEGAGAPCGPTIDAACPALQYCKFSDNLCGQGVQIGECAWVPCDCDGPAPEPTCGCDGQIHTNSCEANLYGLTDISFADTCPPVAASFRCGAGYCSQGTQYCQKTGSDVGGEPDSYICRELPAACGAAPDCACVASETCGNLCEQSAEGDLTLTCLGG